MNELTEKEKIEINRVLDSIKGRLDDKLIKLVIDLVMKTKWSQEVEKVLYKKNIERIPGKQVDAVLIGSHIGQIYQISLDFAKKFNIELKPIQKNILREFIFFMVLFRTDRKP
ncbi:hypothetical protein NsoK4_04525 [Nitrosopumilus sp. K4]|uniref:hypothetical protein n=1 Tax=Nitrosopumilus sp. K4 TaxID=2795383 RepID=UPI001BA995CC|nr:hypothetical protein [Nitrosopumilus sp. K4]QUC65507.1 hypothetical protein NsoK4_04525 [Nitrosopumilus sp. K4]